MKSEGGEIVSDFELEAELGLCHAWKFVFGLGHLCDFDVGLVAQGLELRLDVAFAVGRALG